MTQKAPIWLWSPICTRGSMIAVGWILLPMNDPHAYPDPQEPDRHRDTRKNDPYVRLLWWVVHRTVVVIHRRSCRLTRDRRRRESLVSTKLVCRQVSVLSYLLRFRDFLLHNLPLYRRRHLLISAFSFLTSC